MHIDLGSRNVVNAITALCDDEADLLESIFGAIVRFKRAAWPKAGSDNDENDGPEKGVITVVERTVDEDVAASARHQDRDNKPRFISSIVARISFDVKCVGLVFPRRIFTPSLVVPTTL
jgi:hypothetical protein